MPHVSVLLHEVIKYLDPKSGENFVDATVNGGGHAKAILSRISPAGKLLGIDMDSDLIEALKVKSKNEKVKNLILVHGNFADISGLVRENNFGPACPVRKGVSNGVNGALFDLGMSSYHIDQSAGGFSFMKDEPLDMRFSRTDPTSSRQWSGLRGASADNSLTAEEIINKWPERELARIFKEYGEEPQAKKIARIIVEARVKNKIKTTGDLVGILRHQVSSVRHLVSNKTLARVFQALRIAVNNELENISRGLAGAWSVLEPGGRIAVISFHSLEDRIVKNFFKEKKSEGQAEILTPKPVQPTEYEIQSNPRSRSAKMRVIRKLGY